MASRTEVNSPLRPRLIPIPAPWRIEVKPRLCLVTGETPDVQPTEVYAHVEVPSADEGPLEVQVVKLTFEESYAARLMPGEGDMPFDVLAYDFPEPPLNDLNEGMERWAETEQQLRETGVCEGSGLYKVLHSPWMAELAQDEEGYHHYLVMGRYASVEVIAKGWRWERVAS